VIRTVEQVNEKAVLVGNLLELELANQILSSTDTNVEDPLDSYYRQLKTNIEPLDKNGSEWAMIGKYVKNTHARTHRHYNLDVIDIFALERQGEAERCKAFEKLHNRQLLWHGSRTTNFVGILSQGLRIARRGKRTFPSFCCLLPFPLVRFAPTH